MTREYNWPDRWDTSDTIADIVGKTPVRIFVNDCKEIVFTFSDGTACKFYHEQNCCESVKVEDVNGDWADLLNTPLLVADERGGESKDLDYGSQTWTFYTFRSLQGSVDVRWYGESNGYYSERVDFLAGTWVSTEATE